MKSVLLTSLFLVLIFYPSTVSSQNSITSPNKLNEEITYDRNEPIRFLGKRLPNPLRLIRQNSKYGIIDSTGRIVVPLEYDQIDVDFTVRERLLSVEIYTSENEIYYSFWEDGNESQELYDQLREEERLKPMSPFNLETKFTENPFFAAKKANLWGVINAQNEVLIPFAYTSLKEIGQDVFLAKKDGSYSLLTPTNDTIIAFCDSIVDPFSTGYFDFGSKFAAYALLIKDNQFGAINLFNHRIIDPKYDSLEYCYCVPEHCWVCAFDPYDVCLNCTEGQSRRNHAYGNVIKYKQGNKVGLVDMISMEELTPAAYDFIGISGRSPQIIQLDTLFTMLTHDNTKLHEGRYDKVSTLNAHDFLKVSIDGKIGVYNNLGEQIIKCEWQDVLSMFYTSSSSQYIVKRKGKVGVIKDTGRFTFRMKYDEISVEYDRESRQNFIVLTDNGDIEKIPITDLD